MKMKLIALTLTLLMSLSVIACTSAPEKEPDVAPEVTVEEEPVEDSIQEVEESEEIKMKVEISGEHADEAKIFATKALESLFKKNKNYSDTDRRDAISKIAFAEMQEDIDLIHNELDKIKLIDITSVEIGDVSILEGELYGEPVKSFNVDYKVKYNNGETDESDEGWMLIFAEDGEFKYASIYAHE